MVSGTHLALKADDRSYFAILKKQIHALARTAGFTEGKVGEIDIIVAEMVSNLVKHGGGGQILVKLIEEQELQGIEIISIDNGVGIADISRMVADGMSTKNTLGQGLGAMKRLSSVFQIYSQKDWGTVILSRIFEQPLALFHKPAIAEVRSVIVPKPGEIQCGDGFHCITSRQHVKLFLGDGLGHGAEAARAVNTAIDAFIASNEIDPSEIIRNINEAVKKTRGLVGTVAVFDLAELKWKICGVGNISTRLITPVSAKAYMSYNGIIGLNLPRTLNAQEINFEKGQHLIMCSDGLKTRWDIIKYPAILRYDLSILSASLLKDHARNTDDMSVVTCKINL